MLGGGEPRQKKWDNCNSIINKIHYKNKNKGAHTPSGKVSLSMDAIFHAH